MNSAPVYFQKYQNNYNQSNIHIQSNLQNFNKNNEFFQNYNNHQSSQYIPTYNQNRIVFRSDINPVPTIQLTNNQYNYQQV